MHFCHLCWGPAYNSIRESLEIAGIYLAATQVHAGWQKSGFFSAFLQLSFVFGLFFVQINLQCVVHHFACNTIKHLFTLSKVSFFAKSTHVMINFLSSPPCLSFVHSLCGSNAAILFRLVGTPEHTSWMFTWNKHWFDLCEILCKTDRVIVYGMPHSILYSVNLMLQPCR